MAEYDQNPAPTARSNIAVALIQSDGEPIFQSELFRRHFGTEAINASAARRAATSGKYEIGLSDHDCAKGGRPAALAYGSIETARSWRLPDALDLNNPGAAQVVVLGIVPPSQSDWIAEICDAYGFTDIQKRVATALLTTGDIRSAAKMAEIAYGTAREAHRSAMRKLGVDSSPAMVTLLTAHSLGADLTDHDSAEVLSDLYGLTKRQLALITLIADGLTREKAAKIIGVSIAVAKKELDTAYDCLGVSSATLLASIVAEARTMALLTAAISQQSIAAPPYLALKQQEEPFALLEAPEGRRIAYSDYGPSGAPPVLVLHSSMTNRPVFTVLREALQRKGFRVLALDRPGYGLTDPAVSSGSAGSDPFTCAAEDIARFCDAMNLPRVDFVVRSTAPVVLALQRLRPELIGRLVLLNPDNFPKQDSKRTGIVAAAKYALWSRPWLAEIMIKSSLRFTTPALGRFGIWRSVKGSPPDEAVMVLEQNLHDYLRAASMAANGKVTGMLGEYIALAKLSQPSPVYGTVKWKILLGAHDFMYNFNEVQSVWSEVLPDATFHVIDNGGRLLAFSHADLIAEMLLDS